MDRQMEKWTDRIFTLCSIDHCPLLVPLPYLHFAYCTAPFWQGKGTADLVMPLGDMLLWLINGIAAPSFCSCRAFVYVYEKEQYFNTRYSHKKKSSLGSFIFPRRRGSTILLNPAASMFVCVCVFYMCVFTCVSSCVLACVCVCVYVHLGVCLCMLACVCVFSLLWSTFFAWPHVISGQNQMFPQIFWKRAMDVQMDRQTNGQTE